MRSFVIGVFTLFVATFAVAAVPRLVMEADEGGEAVALASARIRVTIRGHLARTEYDLTFRNSLPRVVGGDFIFPVPPDGEVSDLGLYFDGKLRHAVAVERVQAKIAYEETVHLRRVDPVLGEWSDSGAFRMRVYPIPAHGEKRVYIACDQELLSNDYTLDLRFKQRLDSFEVIVDADGRSVDGGSIAGRSDGERWRASGTGVDLDGVVRIARDPVATALVAWSPADSMWYAAAPLTAPVSDRMFERAPNVIVMWDASGSAVQQDRAKLREFVRELLARQTAWTTLSVVPFHLWAEEPRDLSVSALDSIPSLGATNLAVAIERMQELAARMQSSRLVLVSDGISSMDDPQRLAKAVKALAALRRPVTVVNASARANEQFLSMLAASTGGVYVNLTRGNPQEAAERAMHKPSRLQLPADFAPDTISSGSGTIGVATRRSTRPSSIALLGREMPMREIGDADGLVRRAWARARLRELTDGGATRGEITDHGRAFTMLTPSTSLIVLETWRDYEMYGIDLPPDVAAQKERDAQLRPQPQPQPQPWSAWTPPAPTYSGPVGWFVKGTVTEPAGGALPGVTVTLAIKNGSTFATVTDVSGRYWLAAAAPPNGFAIRAELAGLTPATRVFNEAVPSGGTLDLMLSFGVTESITVTAAAAALPVSSDETGPAIVVARSSIRGPAGFQLDPDTKRQAVEFERAALDRRLAIAEEIVARIAARRTTADRLRLYEAARSFLGGEKAFHVHVAELLLQSDDDLALRVLTDLAEANAGDAAVTRIVARIADGWGRSDVARALLLAALDASPREPQTWRELLLLAAKDSRSSELQLLKKRYEVIARDPRMQEVDEQIRKELGRVSWRSGDVRVEEDADLQVELMWDTNYAYVDLHVVGPGGEEVAWDHPDGVNGSITGWLTEGFGPEVYVARGGHPGSYRVDVRYYSSDNTEVTAETLAHVMVYQRGRFGAMKRTDYVIPLSRDEERKTVVTVEVPKR